MSYEQAKKHYLGYCQHFPVNGMSNKTCKKGIQFAAVNDADRGCPCLTKYNCTDLCSSFESRSETDAHKYAIQREAGVQQFLERLASGQCPHCGVPVERRIQVGRCVYAEPCSHRLGQGKA